MAELLQHSEDSSLKNYGNKVVLVENKRTPLSAWKDVLVKNGFEVSTCTGSFDALEQLGSQGAGLIIAETGLADLSGYQLSCLIKSNSLTNSLPVVLVKSDEREDEPFWSHLAQADSVFELRDAKNNGDRVVSEIKELLHRAAREREANIPAVIAGSFSSADVVSSYDHLVTELLLERLVNSITRSLLSKYKHHKNFLESYFSAVKHLLNCDIYGIVVNHMHAPWVAVSTESVYSLNSFNKFLKKFSEDIGITRELELETYGDITTLSDNECGDIEIMPIREENHVLGALLFAPKPEAKLETSTKVIMSQLQLYMQPVLQLLLAQEEIESLRHQEATRVSTDPLTGLYNLEFLIGFLQQQLLFSYRQKSPVGLILIDVDNLKRINEEWGYEVGNLVLSTIANKLLNQTRSSDLIARYGGDEIVVVLPNTELNGTRVVAEKIRLEIEQISFGKYDDSRRRRATVSIGCAEFNMEDLNPETIMHDSRVALQRAKEQGGNKVST